MTNYVETRNGQAPQPLTKTPYVGVGNLGDAMVLTESNELVMDE